MNKYHDTQSLIVAFDCRNGKDKSVLVVGKKRPNKSVDIVNAFQGTEAEELWQKLITKKDANK